MYLLKLRPVVIWLLFGTLFSGCAAYTETGKASYYSNKLAGRKMANGDKYRPGKLTAAHKTLPFGTRLKVTNLDTKKNGESKSNRSRPVCTRPGGRPFL